MHKNFYKNINKISNKNVLLIYFFYISIIGSLTIFYTNQVINISVLADINNNLIYKSIPFGYGSLIDNLINKNQFFVIRHDSIVYYLSRLPFHPIFLSLIIKINSNIYFVYLFKNIILYSFFFYVSFISLKNLNKKLYFFLILIFSIIINYYNLHVSFSLDFADCYLTLLIPLIYILLITDINNKYLLISLILSILYFTKTSMFFLALIVPLLIIFFERTKKYLKFLPILFVIFSVFTWGLFGYYKTERFPFLKSMISNNTEGLSAIMNNDFGKYYPEKSVDLIPGVYKISDDEDKSNFKNEWDVYDYFEKKNNKYLKNNYKEYFFDYMILKIKFIFFGIYKDARFPDKEGNFHNNFSFAYFFNKIVFLLGLFIALSNFIKNLIKKKFNKTDFYFLSLVFLNLMPLMAGWATAKHLVPIYNLSLVFIIFNFKNINKLLKIK